MVIMVEDGAKMTRAFVAIEVDKQVREALAEISGQMRASSVKAVPMDQMHITIAFLGGIDDESIGEIGKLLSAMELSRFEISLMGLGTFSTKSPNVIFAKVLEGREELELMWSYIGNGLEALGIGAGRRKFSAHITVARARDLSAADADYINGFVAAHAGDRFGSFACGGIKLKASTLTPDGPSYRDLFARRFSL